jgi:uncharacterized LabA/DUF88 family protein
MFKHEDQRVGVFIDTQNMYYSARNLFKRKVNFKNILEDAIAGRKLIRARAYVIRTQTDDARPFFEALQKAGIETREKDLLEYDSGHKKGDWDVGLAIDVVQALDMLDVVIIVSGDGDYIPLAEYIRSRGRMVEVMAFRATTSSALIEHVDDYIDLSADKKRYLIGPVSKTKTASPKKNAPKTKTTKKSVQKTSKKSKDEQLEDQIEEAILGGFFMPSKGDDEDDQKDLRKRRLEF